MTDTQIVAGIKSNDNNIWRHIYRSMKRPFFATMSQMPECRNLSSDSIEDIFQDACIRLMDAVKEERFKVMEGNHIFNWLVTVGRFRVMNMTRSSRTVAETATDIGGRHIIEIYKPERAPEEETGPDAATIQAEQDLFLDRVFDSIPETCKAILKHFFWDRMPMDEIASLVGLKNADSAKTTKNRCMNKLKDIANRLVKDEDFAEEVIRNAAERAALRDLLQEEREFDNGLSVAALERPEKDDDPEK